MLLTLFLAIMLCAANLKSQLLKLLVVFPAASAVAAWACTLLA